MCVGISLRRVGGGRAPVPCIPTTRRTKAHADPLDSFASARSRPIREQASAAGRRPPRDSVGSRGEGRLHPLTDRLIDDAPREHRGIVIQVQMPVDGSRHCRLVPLPERGTALDVGEEEGDRS